ncbi:MAG: lamin tail domain-containing protein, partial [Candidatus Thermoplasmatota archaeon]
QGNPGDLSEIITQRDVELAVNLALVIDVASRFRAVDWEAVRAIDSHLEDLLKDYMTSGTIDPADLVALLHHYDERAIPLDTILTQGISAVVDQFLLKYLDYFGLMDAANAVYSALTSLYEAIEGLGRSLAAFLGAEDGENTEALYQVERWVLATMSQASSSEYPPGPLDPRLVPQPAWYGKLVLCDVYQPVDTAFSYSSVMRCNVAESSEPILNETNVEIGTRYNYTLQDCTYTLTTRTSAEAGMSLGYLVDFFPVEMCRSETTSIWLSFYNTTYATKANEHYQDLRGAASGIAQMLAERVTSYLGTAPLKLQGEYRIDPKDNRSIGACLLRAFDKVMGDVFAYFRDNPGELLSALLDLQGSREEMLRALYGTIASNYAVLADRADQVPSAAGKLSGDLLNNSALTTIYGVKEYITFSRYNDLGHSQGLVDEPYPAYDSYGYLTDAQARSLVIGGHSAEAQGDITPYVEWAFDFLSEEEAGYVMPKDVNNGYVIRALEDLEARSGSDILALFVDVEKGLLGMAERWVVGCARAIITAGEVANTDYRPLVDAVRMGEFSMRPSDASNDTQWTSREVLHPSLHPSMLSAVSAAQISDGDVPEPNTFLYSLSAPSGTHFTDLTSLSERPFETRWTLKVCGSTEICLRNDERDLLGPGGHRYTWSNATVPISFGITVTVYSGWALRDAEGKMLRYESTSTLAEDLGTLLDVVKGFFSWVLDSILAPIKWLIDQVTMIIDLLTNLLNRLLSYAQQILAFISEIAGYVVELIQDFVKGIANAVLGALVDWIFSIVPSNSMISFSMFGMNFAVALKPEGTGIPPEAGVPLVLISLSGELFGARAGMRATILELSEEMQETKDTGYDILLEIDIRLWDLFLDLSIDPFTVLQPQIVDCEGGGPGWRFEISAPEVAETYESFGYSLHDIAGLGEVLSNIPIPCLGLKASINAGFNVLYTPPSFAPDHVVINEAEINPRGTDVMEWVELYNPSEEEAVNLSHWTLAVAEQQIVFEEGFVLEPSSYEIVAFDGSEQDSGITISLLNPQGTKVDETIALHEEGGEQIGNVLVPVDGGQYTWQRSPNAADQDLIMDWSFLSSTPGEMNSGKNLSLRDVALRLLEASIRDAWEELSGTMELSLDFIIAYARLVVQKFIAGVLDLVEECIKEVEFFLDVAFKEMTGSAGGGLRLSFVIDSGRAVRKILEWIIGTISAFAAQLGMPNAPVAYPRLDPMVPEHCYVRLEGYVQVGTPKLMKRAVPEGECPESMTIVGRIEANVPAIMALFGKDMGKWRVNFGLYVREMPGQIASKLFGTPEDVDPDVWIFKGCAYEV